MLHQILIYAQLRLSVDSLTQRTEFMTGDITEQVVEFQKASSVR